jgi:hypothetical protein
VPQDRADKITNEILETLTSDQLLTVIAEVIGPSSNSVLVRVQSLEYGVVDVSIDLNIIFLLLLKTIPCNNRKQVEKLLMGNKVWPNHIYLFDEDESIAEPDYPPMCVTS